MYTKTDVRVLTFQIMMSAQLILNLLNATKTFRNHWMIIY